MAGRKDPQKTSDELLNSPIGHNEASEISTHELGHPQPSLSSLSRETQGGTSSTTRDGETSSSSCPVWRFQRTTQLWERERDNWLRRGLLDDMSIRNLTPRSGSRSPRPPYSLSNYLGGLGGRRAQEAICRQVEIITTSTRPPYLPFLKPLPLGFVCGILAEIWASDQLGAMPRRHEPITPPANSLPPKTSPGNVGQHAPQGPTSGEGASQLLNLKVEGKAQK